MAWIFALAPGEMLALIGPNGAGKSTTFNMVNGQLRPDAAPSSWPGWTWCRPAAARHLALGVGRTFQIAETFASLTVVENVQMALLSADRRLLVLAARAEPPARRCAGAARPGGHGGAGAAPLQRAGLWRREAGGAGHGAGPRAPPAADGRAHGRHGPAERLALMALTQQLARERAWACCSPSTAWTWCLRHADRMMVLARGRLMAEGTPQAIRDNAQVQEVYLGSGSMFGHVPRRERAVTARASVGDRNAPVRLVLLLQVQGLPPGTAQRRSCTTWSLQVGRARSWP
jgi:branched-chain amino acid transport system ATP-binding protein